MAETPVDIVNRELREFKRYTGDGLPGEPVNAPLPVGDPQSGVHNPKKVNQRKAMLATLEGGAAEVERAREEADRAEQAVADANAMIVPDDAVTDPKVSPSSLVYHKARAAWPVKYFGSGGTLVGTGNAAIDTAALQDAVLSGEIVDLSGAQLQINDTISVPLESSKLHAAMSQRPAGAGSVIRIVDDALPVLFDIGHDNFEASGFYVRGNVGNVTTTAFNFVRTVDNYRDIDARLVDMCITNVGKAAYIRGRGLEFGRNTVADCAIAAVDLDQPDTWTPRGGTTDLPKTGTRAFHFYDNRAHAMPGPFLRNTGPHALDIGGIIINGLMADIGANGGLISGVLIEAIVSNIQCRYAAVAGSRLLELAPGSRDSRIVNFQANGYLDGANSRLSNFIARLESSVQNPVENIHFIGGQIGPTLQHGVALIGSGRFENICFSDVLFKGVGQAGSYNPINVASGVTSASIKLSMTHFQNSPAAVPVIGNSSSGSVVLMREVTTTKDDSFSSWAGGSVTQITTPP